MQAFLLLPLGKGGIIRAVLYITVNSLINIIDICVTVDLIDSFWAVDKSLPCLKGGVIDESISSMTVGYFYK